MEARLTEAMALGLTLGIAAVKHLKVYVWQPEKGNITADRICIAPDIKTAKEQFLVQLPWILEDMNDICNDNYYESSKHEQLLRLQLWLPDSEILVVPVFE